jgi:sulfur carrier protein
VQLVINGEARSLPGVTTVSDLIERLELTGRIAVEVNEQIVPRGEFATHRLNEGDRVEIVHAIGGGDGS